MSFAELNALIDAAMATAERLDTILERIEVREVKP